MKKTITGSWIERQQFTSGTGTTHEMFPDGSHRAIALCGCEWRGRGHAGVFTLCKQHAQEEREFEKNNPLT